MRNILAYWYECKASTWAIKLQVIVLRKAKANKSTPLRWIDALHYIIYSLSFFCLLGVWLYWKFKFMVFEIDLRVIPIDTPLFNVRAPINLNVHIKYLCLSFSTTHQHFCIVYCWNGMKTLQGDAQKITRNLFSNGVFFDLPSVINDHDPKPKRKFIWKDWILLRQRMIDYSTE